MPAARQAGCSQSRSLAAWAYRLAAVACQHDAVLDFVLVLPYHVHKSVDADILLVFVALVFHVLSSMPEQVAFVVCKVVVRFENSEAFRRGKFTEGLPPFAHLLSAPTHDSTVVDAECFVGDYQVLVDADDPSESFTFRTGSCGSVEGKEIFCGVLKLHAVGFEACGIAYGFLTCP